MRPRGGRYVGMDESGPPLLEGLRRTVGGEDHTRAELVDWILGGSRRDVQ